MAGSAGLRSEPDPLDGTRVVLLMFPGEDGALVAATESFNRNKLIKNY